MNTQIENSDYSATYSPEDDKLRLYTMCRLDDETYQQAKSAGFRWAPKQDLFFAFWSPSAEDFVLSLCNTIDDEDTSLVQRAEQRADRFEGYSTNRLADAEASHAAGMEIAGNIPFGQPILVGHHSERKARKDAERIERSLEKAVQMWDTAEYWKQRAQGAVRSANYKERPDVRARRIKKLEAENRKYQKSCDHAETMTVLWTSDKMDHKRAVSITNMLDHVSSKFPLDQYPREEPASQYEGSMSLWSALTGDVIGWEQARDIALPVHARTLAHYARMIAHNDNRLMYEKTMLEEQGGSDLLKPKARPKQPPMLNYRAPEGLQIENNYHKGTFIHYPQAVMTKAEYAAVPNDYRGGQKHNGHRVRIVMGAYVTTRPEGGEDSTANANRRHSYHCVFLSDSKVHPRPEETQKS